MNSDQGVSHAIQTQSRHRHRRFGAGLVNAFRDAEYRVVANSRSIGAGNTRGSPDVLPIAGDIADPAVARRVVDTAMERFGRIDTLVNNAGIFISKPFVDYAEADFTAMTAVNLAGFFHISQQAASWMLQAGSGHIVTVTARAVQRCWVGRVESAPPHLWGEARRLSARGMFKPGNV